MFGSTNHICCADVDSAELLDSVYELVDNITYKLRVIPPNLWPIFELTYKLFKTDSISWLEGAPITYPTPRKCPFHITFHRNAPNLGQFRVFWR
jgi:hypothetical protein